MFPLRELSPAEFQSVRPADIRPIVRRDFEMAFEAVRASVSPHDLEQLDEWAREFGSIG